MVLATVRQLTRLQSLTAVVREDGEGLEQLAYAAGALAATLTALTVEVTGDYGGYYEEEEDELLEWADPRLEFIGTLRGLRALVLRFEPFESAPPPSWVPSLSGSLTRLELGGASLSPADVAALAPLRALRVFKALEWGEWAAGDLPPQVPPACLPGVTRLDIGCCHLPSLIAAFPAVRDATLSLLYNPGPWQKPAPGAAARWGGLRRLAMTVGAPGDVVGLLDFLGCGGADGSLRRLYATVEASAAVSNADLAGLLRGLPLLQRLSLKAVKLTDAACTQFPSHPALRWLRLGASAYDESAKPPQLTVKSLLALGRALPGLARLAMGPLDGRWAQKLDRHLADVAVVAGDEEGASSGSEDDADFGGPSSGEAPSGLLRAIRRAARREAAAATRAAQAAAAAAPPAARAPPAPRPKKKAKAAKRK